MTKPLTAAPDIWVGFKTSSGGAAVGLLHPLDHLDQQSCALAQHLTVAVSQNADDGMIPNHWMHFLDLYQK